MSSAAAHPDIAAIDAALAKGEWWAGLFNQLAHGASWRLKAKAVENRDSLWRIVADVERLTRALALAVIAAMRLEGFLSGLVRLRKLSPGDLAAARARAKAKAKAEASARETAREKAQARREARAAEVRERVVEIIERERPARPDRDPLIEALDKRLAADPALVELDDLPLREIVMRICADLGITPDWRRWEAGDWTAIDLPTGAALAPKPAPKPKGKVIPALWRPATPTIIPASAVLQSRPGLLARRADTAISLILRSASLAPPCLPPRPG